MASFGPSATMASDDTIRMVFGIVFGIIGNATSLVLYLSPLRTFIAIRTNGSVGEFSPMPYLAALLNCAVWVLYGLVHPNSTPVVIISGIGVVIELVYMAFFVYYSAGVVHRNVFLSLAAELIFVGSVAALVLSLAHSQEGKSMALGMVGVGTSIFMYASPLSTMITVFQTGSVEYMDRNMYLASLANAICWTIYAGISSDLFILIPNLLGVLFAGVQLAVYANFNDNMNYVELD